jgi:hypothetical protein
MEFGTVLPMKGYVFSSKTEISQEMRRDEG